MQMRYRLRSKCLKVWRRCRRLQVVQRATHRSRPYDKSSTPIDARSRLRARPTANEIGTIGWAATVQNQRCLKISYHLAGVVPSLPPPGREVALLVALAIRAKPHEAGS